MTTVNPVFANLSPAVLNSTTLAIANLEFSPNASSEPYMTAGDLWPTLNRLVSMAPAFRFRTPFADAFTLIGFGFLRLTICNFFAATFSAGAKQATGRKWSLATTTPASTATAIITGVSADQGGILMAEVTVVYASGDGLTSPIAQADNQAVPTLSAIPALHTLAALSIAGTTFWGSMGLRLSLGQSLSPRRSDGMVYPTDVLYEGGAPTVEIDGVDPLTMWASLGDAGIDVTQTNHVMVWCRGYDMGTSTPGKLLTTGFAFTCNGRAQFDGGSFESPNAVGKSKVLILPTTGPGGSHPLTITNGSVPVAA